LVKNGKITMKDVAAIKEFCARRGFDTAYFPGIKPEEANKVNVQQEAYLYLGAEALLGGNRESYIENYKFNISPPEDNRPYFNNYFRFSSFPELWSKGTQGGYAFLEHGYLTLLAAMAQILIFAPVFLVLGWLYVRRLPDAELSAARCAIYFSLLGMAFMQTELVFIQKYTLFLGLPVLSASATLASFLIFAGLGGRCSGALGRWSGKRGVNPVSAAVLGILFFLAFHSLVMPWVTRLFWDAPQAARFAIAFLAIGPLAFFMGMPFPTGVTRLAGKGGGLIALAWGANGFMSVAGAVFGLGLAIHWGFDAVLGISAVLYILAALVYKKNPALIQDRA